MTRPTSPRQQQISAYARELIKQSPLYLDTETTGLDNNAEIVEIVVLESDGTVLYESLVKPLSPIPLEATRIHGIGDAHVANAPTWPLVWATLRPLVVQRPLAIYNAAFDLRMMRQSMQRYQLTWRENITAIDIMQLFAEYRGEWDSLRRAYRWVKLEEAGRYFNIPLNNTHRASDDTRLARAVLHALAGLPYED